MKVTVEVSTFDEIEKLMMFFKSLNLDSIQVLEEEKTAKPKIEKGHKSLNPKELFGIWKENPKSIDEIRVNAWKRS